MARDPADFALEGPAAIPAEPRARHLRPGSGRGASRSGG